MFYYFCFVIPSVQITTLLFFLEFYRLFFLDFYLETFIFSTYLNFYFSIYSYSINNFILSYNYSLYWDNWVIFLIFLAFTSLHNLFYPYLFLGFREYADDTLDAILFIELLLILRSRERGIYCWLLLRLLWIGLRIDNWDLVLRSLESFNSILD